MVNPFSASRYVRPCAERINDTILCMSAVRNDERYEKFLILLPKHRYNVKPAAIEAGFSKSFAHGKQKFIMQQALKYKLEKAGMKVEEIKDVPIVEMKRTMAEIVGFSQEELMNNLKEIATQSRDYATRLRVIAPLVREHGVNLDPEVNNNVVVPVLNVTVREKDPKQPLNKAVIENSVAE